MQEHIISKTKKNFSPKIRSIKVPAGTVWYGGSMDSCRVSLRVAGRDLDPDAVSQMLGCTPTSVARDRQSKNLVTGEVCVRSHWRLTLTSEETALTEIDELIIKLLSQLPSDPSVWLELNSRYEVDIFCGLFMNTKNRGFSLKPVVTQSLAERSLEIGFDIYAPD